VIELETGQLDQPSIPPEWAPGSAEALIAEARRRQRLRWWGALIALFVIGTVAAYGGGLFRSNRTAAAPYNGRTGSVEVAVSHFCMSGIAPHQVPEMAPMDTAHPAKLSLISIRVIACRRSVIAGQPIPAVLEVDNRSRQGVELGCIGPVIGIANSKTPFNPPLPTPLCPVIGFGMAPGIHLIYEPILTTDRVCNIPDNTILVLPRCGPHGMPPLPPGLYHTVIVFVGSSGYKLAPPVTVRIVAPPTKSSSPEN
jgi:hypothetical protein